MRSPIRCLAAFALLACGGGEPSGPAPGGSGTDDTDTGPADTDSGPWPTGLPCEQPVPIVLDFEFETYRFQEFNVLLHIPEHPRALMFVFHPGDTGIFGVQSLELYSLYNHLNARGVALVATESTGEGWHTDELVREDNIDFPRIRDLYESLKETGGISPDLPVVAMGMSSGGWYSANFALFGLELGWPVALTMHHISAPDYGPDLPANFWAGANDFTVPAPEVRAAYEGHPSSVKVYMEHPALVLDPRYFMRSPDFDEALSQEHFDELVLAGAIDADGVLLLPPERLGGFINDYKDTARPRRAAQVSPMLEAAWGRHRYHDEFLCEQLEFFDQVLSDFVAVQGRRAG